MSFLKKILFVMVIGSIYGYSIDNVSYANATLDIEPGARSAALGSSTMALDGDYLGLLSNPQQLANVDYTWVSFSHTAYYEDTQYDYFSLVIPLDNYQGLGFSLSRFGASDIPYIREGESIPLGSYYGTLSIADYVVSVSWGKRILNKLNIGISFHGIYRDMDQTGFGFRGDAGVRYSVINDLFISGLLKGWTSSATRWESGEFEYSPPDFYLALNYNVPVNYLYGKLGIYVQSASFFQKEARDLDYDTDENAGERLWEDPFDWLSGGRGGLEFNFDFGLSLRAGLSSFTTWESFTAGAGILIADFLNVDYAFESHPVLSPIHRVSISISPYLFSHAKQKESHLNLTDASKSLLKEESDELNEKNEATNAYDKGEITNDTSDLKQKETEMPSDKDYDDLPISTPSGGMYWEE